MPPVHQAATTSPPSPTLPVVPPKPLSFSTQYLNWYYDFNDIQTRHEFYEFNRERGPTKFFQLLLFLITIALFPSTIYHIVLLFTTDESSDRSNQNNDASLHHHLLSDHNTQLMMRCIAVVNVLISCGIIICGWQIILQGKFRLIKKLPIVRSITKFVRKVKNVWFKAFLGAIRCWPSSSSESPSLRAGISSVDGNRRDSTSSATNSGAAAGLLGQRIEISVFREFGSGGGGAVGSSSAHSHIETIRRSALPDSTPHFFAALPILPSMTSRSGNPSPRNSLSSRSILHFNKVRPLPPSPKQTSGKPADESKPETLSMNNLRSSSGCSSSQGALSIVLTPSERRMLCLKTAVFVLIEIYLLLTFISNGLQDCSDTTSKSGNYGYLPNTINVCELSDYFVLFHTWVLLLLPYLLFVALPDLSIIIVWCTLGTAFTIILALTAYLEANHSWLIIFIYLFFVIAMVIDTQVYKVQMFLTTRKLGGILEEQELMAIQNHAQEMRHMIANVAHDLKTVSCMVLN